MDGFRDALEHVIELTPEGPARAQLYSELAYRGANPATWTNPPARETVETWIERALEQGGSDPAVRARTLIARTTLDPVETADAARETLAIVKRHRVRTRCSVRPTAISRTAPPLSVTSRRRAGGRIASARSRPRSPTAASGRCGTCTPPWSTCGWDGSRRRTASPRSTTRWRPACHRTTTSMPSGPRCSRGPSSAAGRRRAASAAGVEAASVANADTLCDMNWRSLLMAALALARLGDEREARRLEELAARDRPAARVARTGARLPAAVAPPRRPRRAPSRCWTPIRAPTSWTDVDYARRPARRPRRRRRPRPARSRGPAAAASGRLRRAVRAASARPRPRRPCRSRSWRRPASRRWASTGTRSETRALAIGESSCPTPPAGCTSICSSAACST